MSRDALDKLDAEIAKQEALLNGLKWARQTIAAPEPETRQQLLIEGPRAKKGKAPKRQKLRDVPKASGDHTGIYVVNGVEVPCTEQQEAMYDMMMAAEGDACVGSDQLLPIFDNSKSRMRRAIEDACVRLAPAKATIQSVRGQGYRLINVEA